MWQRCNNLKVNVISQVDAVQSVSWKALEKSSISEDERYKNDNVKIFVTFPLDILLTNVDVKYKESIY